MHIGADVVVEVVRLDNPERDTHDKRQDYAEAGIPEHWIVDPEDDTITVLTLEGDAYNEDAAFRRGDTATSLLLAGFSTPVDAVLDTR